MFNSLANKFFFNLIKDKPIYIAGILVLSLSSIIFDVIGTILVITIAVVLFENGQEILLSTDSVAVRYLFTFCNGLVRDRQLTFIVALTALLFVLKTLAGYGGQVIGIRHTKYLTYQMRLLGFGLLARVDIDYFNRHKVSEILFKINREIDKVALLIKSWNKLMLDLISIFILIVLLLFISIPLTIIGMSLISMIIIVNYYFSIYAKKQSKLILQKSREYNRVVINFLTGIYDVKVNANEAQEYETIISYLHQRNNSELKAQATSAAIRPLNEIVTIFITAIILIASYHLSDNQVKDFIPVFLIYISVFLKLIPIINQINNDRLQISSNAASINMVAGFLNETKKPIMASANSNFDKLQHSIEFDNVTFAYPNQPQIVLDKINFKILRGETIALVGGRGSGKSTIVNLLARLYEPIEGKIAIDGKNIQEYSLISLRNNISIINQDIFLFNSSLADNLTYGLNNISEDQIIAAAKESNAYDFIAQLPQGLNTIINENFKLIVSEPQRQLIAITRALLRNPDLVILDLIIDNLDKNYRELIQNALDKLCRDRTIVVITNQLATIKKADRIVVLNKGKIIESGTHQQLLKQGNLYRRMCAAQFKTSQQSHQQQLAKKISQKLARQTNNSLSSEIRNNLNSLLNYLQLINEGSIEDDREQERILDESYQSAKNMLASLREYEKKISRGFKKKD